MSQPEVSSAVPLAVPGGTIAPPDPGPAPGPVRRAVALVWALLLVDAVGATATLLSVAGDGRDAALAADPAWTRGR